MKKSLIEKFFYFCAVTVPASFPSDEMGVRITLKIREISHILIFISKKKKKNVIDVKRTQRFLKIFHRVKFLPYQCLHIMNMFL